MQITVIIPHLRGHEILLDSLGDLEQERKRLHRRGIVLKVLVVDNASTDGSVRTARERYPWIHILRLARNHGYAGGCNRGIQASNGEWVWLLNDDVRLKPGVVEAMLEIALSDDKIAAVQPKILSYQDNDTFDYAGGAGGLIDRFGYPFAYGRIGGDMEKDTGQYEQPREIFWASGTACLWRRSALDDIGLLDEDYFAHQEEIDLSWRAWLMGHKIVSAPHGLVFHRGGATLSYQSWRKMYLNHRNSLVTVLKNIDRSDLVGVLIARLVLDHGIGVIEALRGHPGRFAAVLAAWRDFIRTFRRDLKKRNKIQRLRRLRRRDLAHVIYPGSILFAYARGVRKVTQLVANPATET